MCYNHRKENNMALYGLRVLLPFFDIEAQKDRQYGEIVETHSLSRVNNILQQGLGELLFCKQEKTTTTKSILIHHTELYKVGGIETAAKNISMAFPNYDITFVVGRHANMTQIMELSKRHKVIIDNEVDKFKADILILMNYDSAQHIINRVEADKVYQFCHADWQGLKDSGSFKNYILEIHPRVDKVLAVSETAQKGLKTAFNIDSIVVPNIFYPAESKRLVFMCLSRATNEKGIDRLLELVDRFKNAGKDFVVFLCSPLEQAERTIQERIKASPNIVVLPALPCCQELLRSATYLVQLSTHESYCYSVREALARQVPCLVSRIPELEKLIKDGENGYVLNHDLSNLDIDKIFNKIPKPKPYSEPVPEIWYKVLEGEL